MAWYFDALPGSCSQTAMGKNVASLAGPWPFAVDVRPGRRLAASPAWPSAEFNNRNAATSTTATPVAGIPRVVEPRSCHIA